MTRGRGPVRVLVVDDAVVVRRLLADLLAKDPAIEVAGVAANGRIALAKLPLLDPDVVVLDVEMPELDGLATLAEIRRQRPRLPVIMFSSLTERGAAATLEALALGATDYVTKPAAAGGPGVAMRQVRQELATKVKVLSGRQERPAGPPGPARTAPPSWRATRPGPVEVVAVGSSTGGPNALAELLSRLPPRFAVPVVVVQHMPPCSPGCWPSGWPPGARSRWPRPCQVRCSSPARCGSLPATTTWWSAGPGRWSSWP